VHGKGNKHVANVENYGITHELIMKKIELNNIKLSMNMQSQHNWSLIKIFTYYTVCDYQQPQSYFLLVSCVNCTY